jgi:hypothetical protein
MHVARLLVAVSAAAAAVAQLPSPLFRGLEREMPYGRTALLVGDLDLDGDLDALDAAGVLLNDGRGRLIPSSGSAFGGVVDPRPLALLDLDADGDLDLLLRTGAAPGALGFALNLGGGVFAPTSAPAAPSAVHAAANGGNPTPRGVFAADLEPDGDVDLVWSDPSGTAPPELWRRTGATFTLDTGPFATALFAAAPYIAAVRDADGDGDPDFLGRTLLGGAPNDHVLVANGAGITATTALVVLTSAGSPDGVLLDVDLSPPLDLLLPGPPGPPSQDLIVLGGAAWPGGYSSPIPTSRPFDANAYLAFDLDGDGDDEAARAGPVGYEFFDVSPTGAGGSVLRTWDGIVPGTLRAADFDADGDVDVLGAYVSGTVVFLFNSAGLLSAPPGGAPDVLGGGFRCVAADVEGDGDVDLVGHVLGVPFGPLAVVANDGRGRFAAPASPAAPPPYQDLAGPIVVADFDADGRADLFEGGVSPTAGGLPIQRADVLRLGQAGPPAGFGATLLTPALSDAATAVVAFDFDGDLDLDAAVARRNPSSFVRQSLRLYANLGGGAFAASGAFGGAHWISGLAVGDFDGDGDPDVAGAVAANVGLPGSPADASYVLWNQGGGVYVDAALTPAAAGAVVAAADFDQDGDVDLAVDGHVRLQAGGGVFLTGPAITPPAGRTAADLRLETARDCDGDGYPDLVGLGGYYRNLAGIGFAPWEERPLLALVQRTGGYRPPDSVADLDRDGDPDLADPEGRIYWNVRRHVARGAPARVGGLGGIELYGPAGAWFELFVAAQPAIPSYLAGTYGRVFVDAPSAVFLGLGAFGPTGETALAFAVPNAPALVGLSLWWQAVLPLEAKLTGVEETPFVAY